MIRAKGHRPAIAGRRALSVVVAAAVVLASAQPALAQPSPDPDPWFGPDKALHFGAGFGIGVGGYLVGAGPAESRWAGVGLGIAFAAAIGGAKEGIDALRPSGQPSVRDFVWDIVGSALGVGVSLTFDAALRGNQPE